MSYGSDTPTNFTNYDRVVSSSIPFIVALWSNSTTIAATGGMAVSEPWADARIGCVRPGNVKAGSRVPNLAFRGKISLRDPSPLWALVSLVFLMTSNAFF